MDDQENYDPGIVNTIVDRVRDHGREGDADEESISDRSRGSVEGLSMGGQNDANEEATRETPIQDGPGAATENRGNFGDAHDIADDNSAVQNASEGLTPESLTEEPADADPDVSAGLSGV